MRKISYRWLIADAVFSICCLGAICLIIFLFNTIKVTQKENHCEIKVIEVIVNEDTTFNLFDFMPG